MCVSCNPCPIKSLARHPRLSWEEAPARFSNLGTYGNEDLYGKVQASAGEGRRDICRMSGGLARRHDKGPPVERDLSRSLGSHDAAEQFGEKCHGNGCRRETTRLHVISYTKTGWSSLTHNRVLHEALAQSLRESKVQFDVEDTWPFRQRASEQNGRLNPLRMDITTEAGALFDNHPRLKNKALLLDITIVNPCAGSNLGNAGRHLGKHLADAIERKKNKCRGSFPVTYTLLLLALSTCDEVGSYMHALIKKLAIRRVEHRAETDSNESQHLAEGTKAARLRRQLSFVLQQALSFHMRHHLRRQGVALASTRQLRSQAPEFLHAHRT